VVDTRGRRRKHSGPSSKGEASVSVERLASGNWSVTWQNFSTKDEAIARASEILDQVDLRADRPQHEVSRHRTDTRPAEVASRRAEKAGEIEAELRDAIGGVVNSEFMTSLIAALGRRLVAIPETELRNRDDESPQEVADRFVASKRARNDWDEAVGPFFDTAGVIAWADLGNRQNVRNAVERGDILSVPVGARVLYPRFQFSESGQLLPGLREVLRILRMQMESAWTQALWLNTPVPTWDARTPAQMLHRGDDEPVLRLARADTERRAS
jgi:hypothetical protein